MPVRKHQTKRDAHGPSKPATQKPSPKVYIFAKKYKDAGFAPPAPKWIRDLEKTFASKQEPQSTQTMINFVAEHLDHACTRDLDMVDLYAGIANCTQEYGKTGAECVAFDYVAHHTHDTTTITGKHHAHMASEGKASFCETCYEQTHTCMCCHTCMSVSMHALMQMRTVTQQHRHTCSYHKIHRWGKNDNALSTRCWYTCVYAHSMCSCMSIYICTCVKCLHRYDEGVG